MELQKVGEIFIEIKGWWTDQSRNKWELMKKQFPSVDIVLIDSSTYSVLAKFYKNLIPNWEMDNDPRF